MTSEEKGSHLTLENRKIIQSGIEHGATKKSIADTIGKDNSTVGKEIAQHRALKSKCPLPLECSAYQHCKLGRNCTIACPKYVPFKCTRRDRSPGACNGRPVQVQPLQPQPQPHQKSQAVPLLRETAFRWMCRTASSEGRQFAPAGF